MTYLAYVVSYIIYLVAVLSALFLKDEVMTVNGKEVTNSILRAMTAILAMILAGLSLSFLGLVGKFLLLQFTPLYDYFSK